MAILQITRELNERVKQIVIGFRPMDGGPIVEHRTARIALHVQLAGIGACYDAGVELGHARVNRSQNAGLVPDLGVRCKNC